ncbi:hypothetical protein N665_0001s0042 [Sinapis alba]|nr:hypothetical protein N665_0001s0042 [Sinapis alba]
MNTLRRTTRVGGQYESRSLMIYGGLNYSIGRGKWVIISSFPTRPHDAVRDAISSRKRKHRPFTNRTRDIIRRRMRGLEPLSSDSESEYETETEEKLSEATTSTLPSSSMQEQDLQADAPPLKLEDVIPPTQASSSRNKKRRNKKLLSKTTPPPN